MDKHLVFKQAILSVFEVYAEYLHAGHTSTVEYHTVADEKNDRYQLAAVGWEQNTRIFYVIFQADIIDGKVWIQVDNTEDGLAALLEEKGVSKQDIVLAYFPAYHRKYTEYAVA